MEHSNNNRLNDTRSHPLFAVFFFFALGIVIDFMIPIKSYVLILSLLTLSLLCILSSLKHRQTNKGLPYLCASLMLLGALNNQLHRVKEVNYATQKAYSFYAQWEGPVVATDKTYRGVGRVDHHKLQLTLLKDSATHMPQSGDIIAIHARVDSLTHHLLPTEYNYSLYLKQNGIVGKCIVSAKKWRIIGKDYTPGILERIRHRLFHKLQTYLSGQNLAILNALSLGDKSLLSKRTKQLFAETGTSHALALSGLHLSILFIFYNLFIGLLKRKKLLYHMGVFLGIAFIWAYTTMVGMPISLVRSAIMLSIVQLSVLLHRDVFSINNLSIAGVILLVLSPSSILMVGFQLSFAAVLSILLFMPFFSKWANKIHFRPLRFCILLLFTSLSAQLGTLPLVAYHFHLLTPYSLLTSLFVIPLLYPILFVGLLILLLPFHVPFLGGLENLLLSLLQTILEKSADLPHSVLSIYPSLVEVFVFYCAIFFLYKTLSHKRLLHFCSALSLFFICGVMYAVRVDYQTQQLSSQIRYYDLPYLPNVHCIVSQRQSYLWTSDSVRMCKQLNRLNNNYWKKDGLQLPIVFSSYYSDSLLYFNGRILLFNNKRIAIVNKNTQLLNRQPIEVDALIVCPSCYLSDSELQKYYKTNDIRHFK